MMKWINWKYLTHIFNWLSFNIGGGTRAHTALEEGTVTCFVLVIQGCCHSWASTGSTCTRNTSSCLAFVLVGTEACLVLEQRITAFATKAQIAMEEGTIKFFMVVMLGCCHSLVSTGSTLCNRAIQACLLFVLTETLLVFLPALALCAEFPSCIN